MAELACFAQIRKESLPAPSADIRAQRRYQGARSRYFRKGGAGQSDHRCRNGVDLIRRLGRDFGTEALFPSRSARAMIGASFVDRAVAPRLIRLRMPVVLILKSGLLPSEKTFVV